MERKTKRIQELETLSLLSLVLLVIGLATELRLPGRLAIALLTVALFVKPLAGLITRWWLKFSALIAAVNCRVILTAVYFLVLTPLAVLYRVFHRDSLSIGARERESLYVERNHDYSVHDLEKMW